MIGSIANTLLRAVSRFYALKFHSTRLSGVLARGIYPVNFGLTRTFYNDPRCFGFSTKFVEWVSPRNTVSPFTITLERGNYIIYLIKFLHSSYRTF